MLIHPLRIKTTRFEICFKTDIQGAAMSYTEFITENWQEIIRIFFELTIVALFIKFKLFQRRSKTLVLSDQEVQRLVDSFAPLPLINTDTDHKAKYDFGTMTEMADYDVFHIRDRFKDEIKQTIRHYGVGTCGPPGFYGTLDLHLELEKKLADIVGLPSSILYCNNFTCVNSVITCFCRRGDIIFYHRHSNEAILRGLYATKATTIEFEMCTLEEKLSKYVNKKYRNFVIVEGLFRNTGEILDLPKILELKRRYPLRLIVDESLSIPLLDRHGISKFYGTDVNEIDVVIGSLAHAFCSNGAFVAGNMHIVDYQRLLAPAYCFSASLPGFLTKFVLLALDLPFHRFDARCIHEQFRSERYTIVSDERSPIIVVRMNETGKNALRNAIDGSQIGIDGYGFAKACRMGDNSTDGEQSHGEDGTIERGDAGKSNKERQDLDQRLAGNGHSDANDGQNVLNMMNTGRLADKRGETDEFIIVLDNNDEQSSTSAEQHGSSSDHSPAAVDEACDEGKIDANTHVSTGKDDEGARPAAVDEACDEGKIDANTHVSTGKDDEGAHGSVQKTRHPAAKRTLTTEQINTLSSLKHSAKLSQILKEFDLSSTDLDKIPTKTARVTYSTEDRFRIAMLLTIEKKVKEFARNKIRVGLVLNPEAGIRMCVKSELGEKEMERIVKCMNAILK
ncbi:hypothetical protein VCUG_02059 [Vavraia culicis subsp. floridensis]|uniref:serine C-palmitoyltransferase n=1 Tax=Vavraia culicis (isolate floridensis) TaxID=948595 RepID=L2GS65_VAVCU|nr:uncharacterized protein VCUG_02059 [Vavraia culicis subsp. floridensis]ELA46464.1 hypothetical protein VCUG_02059 [Vavraia culicis subsp. floridensis]